MSTETVRACLEVKNTDAKTDKCVKEAVRRKKHITSHPVHTAVSVFAM